MVLGALGLLTAIMGIFLALLQKVAGRLSPAPDSREDEDRGVRG